MMPLTWKKSWNLTQIIPASFQQNERENEATNLECCFLREKTEFKFLFKADNFLVLILNPV